MTIFPTLEVFSHNCLLPCRSCAPSCTLKLEKKLCPHWWLLPGFAVHIPGCLSWTVRLSDCSEQHAEVTKNLASPRKDYVLAARMEAFLEMPYACGILDIAFSRGKRIPPQSLSVMLCPCVREKSKQSGSSLLWGMLCFPDLSPMSPFLFLPR